MKYAMSPLCGKSETDIALRLDSIRGFDQIFVFQDGHIIEQGSFDELIEKRQYFHDLYYRATALMF